MLCMHIPLQPTQRIVALCKGHYLEGAQEWPPKEACRFSPSACAKLMKGTCPAPPTTSTHRPVLSTSDWLGQWVLCLTYNLNTKTMFQSEWARESTVSEDTSDQTREVDRPWLEFRFVWAQVLSEKEVAYRCWERWWCCHLQRICPCLASRALKSWQWTLRKGK